MEKEDKTLVKCLMFTASLVFAVLTFCMLISISIDYNEMATNGNLLNGANLKPLLIMFYIVGGAHSCHGCDELRSHFREWREE